MTTFLVNRTPDGGFDVQAIRDTQSTPSAAKPIAKRKTDPTGRFRFDGSYHYCDGAAGRKVELRFCPGDPDHMQWRDGPNDPWQDCRRAAAIKAIHPQNPFFTRLAEVDMELLRALRGGPMESGQITERWPSTRPNTHKLQSAGLIHKTGNTYESTYRLTSEGARACEPRNPASAKPRRVPKAGPNVRNPTGRCAAGHYLRE